MSLSGSVELNLDDEIIRDTLVAHEGELLNPRMRDILGMEPLPEPEEETSSPEQDAEASSTDTDVDAENGGDAQEADE